MAFFIVSDPHMDHADDRSLDIFLRNVNDCTSAQDILMITGDISTSRKLHAHLELLSRSSNARLLYVLGNHDYWGSSIASTNDSLSMHDGTNGNPTFMDHVDVVHIDDSTCVVGESAWYDGRLGQQGEPTFIMNDWYKIQEFYDGNESTVRQISARIADSAAERLRAKLQIAHSRGYKRIIVMTHYPTHEGSCMHLGRPSDHYALPWFSSKVTGDVIDEFSLAHSEIMLEVVCGHTHSPCKYRASGNVMVSVTGASYGCPRIIDWHPVLW